MSNYDGMEAVRQRNRHDVQISAHSNYTNTISTIWGQWTLLLLLFLFISTVHTKPLKFSNYISSPINKDSSEYSSNSGEKLSSNSQQNKLTLLKELVPSNSLLSELPKDSVKKVAVDSQVTTLAPNKKASDSTSYSRFYIRNIFSHEFRNALTAINHDLLATSLEEKSKRKENNNRLPHSPRLKKTPKSTLMQKLRGTSSTVVASIANSQNLETSSQSPESTETLSQTLSELQSPDPTVFSRSVRNTVEPATNMDVTDQANARNRNGAPHWSLPCKVDDSPNPQNTPSHLSTHIFNSVNVAHKHAHRFKETFANRLWDGMDWNSVEMVIQPEPFEFINRLTLPTDEELRTTSFNEALSIAYESMQRRAVSIEQVTLDQALYRDLNDTDFLGEFRKIEGEIVSVLCELHYAMKQRNVHTTVDITAEIMEERYRDVDNASDRLSRDTRIMREYLNGLDYVLEVFTYFKNETP